MSLTQGKKIYYKIQGREFHTREEIMEYYKISKAQCATWISRKKTDMNYIIRVIVLPYYYKKGDFNE